MPKIDERIKSLEAKLSQLKVRQQRKETRAQAIVSRRTRQQELRRKILVGAVVLAKVEDGTFDDAVLRGWLDLAVTRADDRVLLGLPNVFEPPTVY